MWQGPIKLRMLYPYYHTQAKEDRLKSKVTTVPQKKCIFQHNKAFLLQECLQEHKHENVS